LDVLRKLWCGWCSQVYWAGPIAGGVLAGGTYTLIFRAKKEEDEKESYELPL